MRWRPTSPLTDAPWSPPPLPAPRLPPPVPDAPETRPTPLSLTRRHTVPCSRSRRETAQSLATLIRSGEALRPPARVDMRGQAL